MLLTEIDKANAQAKASCQETRSQHPPTTVQGAVDSCFLFLGRSLKTTCCQYDCVGIFVVLGFVGLVWGQMFCLTNKIAR